MRIACLGYDMRSGPCGGMNRHILQIAKFSRHEVTVPIHERFIAGKHTNALLSRIGLDILNRADLKLTLDGADLVHAHGITVPPNTDVYTAHGALDVKTGRCIQSVIDRAKNAQHVLSISEETKRIMEESGIHVDGIDYNAVDMTDFSGDYVETTWNRSALCFFRNHPMRGGQQVIEIANAMPDFTFHQVGLNQRQFEQTFGKPPGNMVLHANGNGLVPHKRMLEIQRACGLYLMAGPWDGFDITCMEMGANYRPSVMFNVGSNWEYVRHGYNGLLAESMEEMPELILRAWNQRELMGRHARKIVEEKFDASVVINKLDDFYEMVANEYH